MMHVLGYLEKLFCFFFFKNMFKAPVQGFSEYAQLLFLWRTNKKVKYIIKSLHILYSVILKDLIICTRYVIIQEIVAF